MTMDVIVADVGGTHCRFAIAHIEEGRVALLDHALVVKTADFHDLAAAWRHFVTGLGAAPPRAAAIAVACPTDEPVLRLTNAPWRINIQSLHRELGLDHTLVLNDFAAISHAVTRAEPSQLTHICGPDEMPAVGMISVVGPGTGLGVAQILIADGRARVLPTEGGHIGFAPHDGIDDEILARIRGRVGRVSVERIVSGPGLSDIYAVIAARHGVEIHAMSDEALWSRVLGGADPLARDALNRFCRNLGAVAGDIALAQGAHSIVIAGGVGTRLARFLPASEFRAGLVSKGRFRSRLEALPVKSLDVAEPGLFGAAIAFADCRRT